LYTKRHDGGNAQTLFLFECRMVLRTLFTPFDHAPGDTMMDTTTNHTCVIHFDHISVIIINCGYLPKSLRRIMQYRWPRRLHAGWTIEPSEISHSYHPECIYNLVKQMADEIDAEIRHHLINGANCE
jgi:hypothetical protein